MKESIRTDAITIISSNQSIDMDGINTMKSYHESLLKEIEKEHGKKLSDYVHNDIECLSDLYLTKTWPWGLCVPTQNTLKKDQQ